MTSFVWTVEVPERIDGLYVFANEDDAQRFARSASGFPPIEQVVCERTETDALIEAEQDES